MTSTLVTGATGFIASYLIPFLVQQGWRVHAAVRRRHLPASQFPTVTSTVIGDIHGSTDWQDALRNIDTVIHLAARAHVPEASHNEAEFFKVNAEGTANLVKQSIAAGVKHFVLVSSVGTITTQSGSPLTERSPANLVLPTGAVSQAEQSLAELTRQEALSGRFLNHHWFTDWVTLGTCSA